MCNVNEHNVIMIDMKWKRIKYNNEWDEMNENIIE